MSFRKPNRRRKHRRIPLVHWGHRLLFVYPGVIPDDRCYFTSAFATGDQKNIELYENCISPRRCYISSAPRLFTLYSGFLYSGNSKLPLGVPSACFPTTMPSSPNCRFRDFFSPSRPRADLRFLGQSGAVFDGLREIYGFYLGTGNFPRSSIAMNDLK